jgi:hypothetical protein
MKRFIIAAALAAVAGFNTSALADDVGVSLSIGQPGFYGRLDMDNYPPPRVLYREPMRVERESMDRPPVYMRVPRGHARKWRNHCGEYGVCNERVYFVNHNWYNREYVPRYHEQQGRRGDDDHNHRREHGNNGNHNNRREYGNNGNHRGQGHNR